MRRNPRLAITMRALGVALALGACGQRAATDDVRTDTGDIAVPAQEKTEAPPAQGQAPAAEQRPGATLPDRAQPPGTAVPSGRDPAPATGQPGAAPPGRAGGGQPAVPAPAPGRGTAAPQPGGDAEADARTLERLRREARALARAEGCSSADQCASAPMGAKPCGGPWEYLVYCRATTDTTALNRKLGELRTFEQAYNTRHGMVSDCMLVGRPMPRIEGGACRAQ